MNTISIDEADYPLQMRKLVIKLQNRLEDDIQNKLQQMQRNLERKLGSFLDENDYMGGSGVSRADIKRAVYACKEDIIQDVRENQRRDIKLQIGQVQDNLDDKIKQNHKEQCDAVKYLNDKLNLRTDGHPSMRKFTDLDIQGIKNQLLALEKKVEGGQVMSPKSYIGHQMNDKDIALQKVDNKLDKIYEYQQQMSKHDMANDEKQQLYHKFSESIVGLVQNLVQNGSPGKNNTDQMTIFMNELNKKQTLDADVSQDIDVEPSK